VTNPQHHNMRRRDLLLGAMGAPAIVAAAAQDSGVNPTVRKSKLQSQRGMIELENQKPGDRDWQLTRVRINEGQFRTSLIEGYCSHQSIEAGETLQLFVSTQPAREFTSGCENVSGNRVPPSKFHGIG
jgi:hypothetical protein